jgi:hypothetical protein
MSGRGPMIPDWVCSECTQPMNDESEERRPCQSCGSTRRTANVSVAITARSSIYLLTKAKHREGGREVVRVTEGDSYYRKTGKWNLMRRLVDWGNDWYDEIFRDRDTGEIIYQCAEPLSEHRGHGSAKPNGNNPT